jgi:hypothetical protein
LRSQRRGYQEASPLKVEHRIHKQDVLARTKWVVHFPTYHSSRTVRTALRAQRRA